MPIYEYQCPKCEKTFTKLCYVDTPEAHCPICNSMSKRIMSVVNHTFGWRLTDASHERFSKDEWERDV